MQLRCSYAEFPEIPELWFQKKILRAFVIAEFFFRFLPPLSITEFRSLLRWVKECLCKCGSESDRIGSNCKFWITLKKHFCERQLYRSSLITSCKRLQLSRITKLSGALDIALKNIHAKFERDSGWNKNSMAWIMIAEMWRNFGQCRSSLNRSCGQLWLSLITKSSEALDITLKSIHEEFERDWGETKILWPGLWFPNKIF